MTEFSIIQIIFGAGVGGAISVLATIIAFQRNFVTKQDLEKICKLEEKVVNEKIEGLDNKIDGLGKRTEKNEKDIRDILIAINHPPP